MAYAIREFREPDASAVVDVTRAAIEAIGSHAYSFEQVAAWSARHPNTERFLERARVGHVLLVAVKEDDAPVAYTLLEPDGHLDMLYCHPGHSRRGLADRLLAAAEDRAFTLGLARLFTEASELARPAFERAGYAVTRRRDFTIEHNGKDVAIHNFAMEKRLD